jgi:hypothetical protein
VGQVVIDSAAALTSYISDATFTCEGCDSPVENLLQSTNIDRVHLVFGSGAAITVSCESGVLILKDSIRHLENWIGPL